uniref:Uncharacterized protein n=1 Tax=Salix viminalis TaxID=40686 RepID=A0A6N2JWY9_SALVM
MLPSTESQEKKSEKSCRKEFPGKDFLRCCFASELLEVLNPERGNGRNLCVLDALAEVERLKCQELAAAGNVPSKNVTTLV